jgi:hypothetical protein
MKQPAHQNSFSYLWFEGSQHHCPRTKGLLNFRELLEHPSSLTNYNHCRNQRRNQNFLIWTSFGMRNRFPRISLISHQITMVYGAFFQNNYGAIIDRARFSKLWFLSASWNGVLVLSSTGSSTGSSCSIWLNFWEGGSHTVRKGW